MLAEYLVNYEDTLNLPTLSKPQDDARDVLLNEFDRLEQEVEWLREAARWIPVEERLPEPLIPVEVVMDGMVTNLMLSPDKETWMNVAGWPYSASSITHWRALPEPPEVE